MFNVEQVAASEEWFIHPWVLVDAVDASGSLFTVDDNSFVHAELVSANYVVAETFLLVAALDDLDLVFTIVAIDDKPAFVPLFFM